MLKRMANSKERIVYLFSLIFLGYMTFRFYMSCWDKTSASDFNNHINTAKDFLKYLKYGWNAICIFKEENQYSHVIAYPMWHIMVMVLYNILNWVGSLSDEYALHFSAAIVNTILNLVTFGLVVSFLKKKGNYIQSVIVSSGLMLCGPLDNFGAFDTYYLGAYTMNVWHNPTYLVVKPVALYCFFLYVDLVEDEKSKMSKYVRASLVLLISALCKPSFYQFFIPGLAGYCAFHFLQKKDFKLFVDYLKVACTCLPVSILAIIQSTIAIGGNGGAGLSFGPFYVIKHYTENWQLCIILSIAFPLYVFILCALKRKWDIRMGLACWSFGSALGMYILFYIDENPFAADFSWGVDLAICILFVIATKEMMQIKSYAILPGYLLLFLHVFFGFIYFTDVWTSGYYIDKLRYYFIQ